MFNSILVLVTSFWLSPFIRSIAVICTITHVWSMFFFICTPSLMLRSKVRLLLLQPKTSQLSGPKRIWILVYISQCDVPTKVVMDIVCAAQQLWFIPHSNINLGNQDSDGSQPLGDVAPAQLCCIEFVHLFCDGQWGVGASRFNIRSSGWLTVRALVLFNSNHSISTAYT